METTKDEVVRLIRSMPDDTTLEEIQYHLYVWQKVERGLAAAAEGRAVPQDEAERRVDEWPASINAIELALLPDASVDPHTARPY